MTETTEVSGGRGWGLAEERLCWSNDSCCSYSPSL